MRIFKMKKKSLGLGATVLPCALLLLSPCQTSMASEPAPGRGMIPVVSEHYKTKPSIYDFNRMPTRKITPLVNRRFVIGTESSLTQWTLKAGAKLPLHFHINEQITIVEKGELEVYSQGQKYILKSGEVMVFPPNVPHEFIALKNTVIYGLSTPLREDFINGAFDKKLKALLH